MKKTKLFGWALVAYMMGASFSACTNEADEVLAQESEIKLTSEITRSRVISDLQSEQLEESRTIGVTITGSKSGDDYVNKPWTSDGEGGLSTEHPVYWANTNVNVTAYHPYNVDWTSGTQTFTVKTDQSVEANYLNSDLLFANKPNVAKSTDPISLTFYHKLAKVNVTLQPEYPEMDLSNAVISICNTKTSTTLDLSNGTVPTEATGDFQEIKAGVGSTASAIVVPQTIASSTKFIKIELGEKIFYYTLPTDKQLKSGYSHNYTLTVKETAVQIDNSSEIKDWTDENVNTGDAQEVDLSWFNPNQYITYVENEYYYFTGKDDDNTHDHSSSISFPVNKIDKMELKFQMKGNPTLGQTCYLFCNNQAEGSNDQLTINETQGMIFTDAKNSYTYSWDELNVNATDLIILTVSFKDGYLKVNGNSVEYKMPLGMEITPSYLFSRYRKEYESGWDCTQGYGVTEGSKLYYAKIWNENDNLIYLGAASTALNPQTNEVENCWRSYFNGKDSYQFANYAEILDNGNPYGPYGGGLD